MSRIFRRKTKAEAVEAEAEVFISHSFPADFRHENTGNTDDGRGHVAIRR